jgi:hypothetical protein
LEVYVSQDIRELLAEIERLNEGNEKLINERDAALARVAELERKFAAWWPFDEKRAAEKRCEKAEAEVGRLREREAGVLATLGEWRHGWATEYIDRLLAALDAALSAPKPEEK